MFSVVKCLYDEQKFKFLHVGDNLYGKTRRKVIGMRLLIIKYLKTHPFVLQIFWITLSICLSIVKFWVNKKANRILFISYGGRKFDDSPKEIYEEICKRNEFHDYELFWAFVEPDKYHIKRGIKIKVDTFTFFKVLLTSKIWVSNSGMTRGIHFVDDDIIKIETWHGSVLKKGGGEENQNVIGGKRRSMKYEPLDNKTIRCAQSLLDVEVLSRIFHSDKKCFLPCGFPRNDKLALADKNDIAIAKKKLGLPLDKRIILYMPTWREYCLDANNDVVCKPPINLDYWRDKLGKDYVLLFRAHYAVTSSLGICESSFVKNVSEYPEVNDLYLASDVLISDYSSAIIDYSILERPIFCFAYDYEEYSKKRGVYLDLNKDMPFGIQKNEVDLLETILNVNDYKSVMNKFRLVHATYANGLASKTMVNELMRRLNKEGE